MPRTSALLIAGAAALGLAFAGAAPATAATLPASDTIYVIDADGTGLWRVSDTGQMTLVGNLTEGHNVWGADYDPTSGLAYFYDDDTAPCALFSLDLETATETLVGDLEFENCDGLDVDENGVLRILSGDGVIYEINKADGSTVSSVTVEWDGDELALLATDPTSGVVYLSNYDSTVASVDLATGVVTVLGTVDYIESGDFDSNGIFWGAGDGVACQGLQSFDPSDVEGTFAVQGDFMSGDTCVDVFALFVVPGVSEEPEEPQQPAPVPAAPTLPATGPSDAAMVVGGLGGLALLAGAAIAFVARDRRSALSS